MSPNVSGLIVGIAVAAVAGGVVTTGAASAAVPHSAPIVSVGSWAAGDIEDDDREFWGYSSPEDRNKDNDVVPVKRRYHYYYYDHYDLQVGPIFVGSDRGIDAVGRSYDQDWD